MRGEGEGEGWGEGVSVREASTDARYLHVFTRYFALFSIFVIANLW